MRDGLFRVPLQHTETKSEILNEGLLFWRWCVKMTYHCFYLYLFRNMQQLHKYNMDAGCKNLQLRIVIILAYKKIVHTSVSFIFFYTRGNWLKGIVNNQAQGLAL